MPENYENIEASSSSYSQEESASLSHHLLNEVRNLRNPDLNLQRLTPGPLDMHRSGSQNGIGYGEARERSGTQEDIRKALEQAKPADSKASNKLDATKPAETLKQPDIPKPVKQPDGSLILQEKNFGVLGPKAAAIMLEFGVESLKVSHGKDGAELAVHLKAGFEKQQNPREDHCKKLLVEQDVSAVIQKLEDGSIVFSDIEGIKAVVTLFGVDRQVQVSRLQMQKTPDGRTKLTTESYLGLISSSKVKYADIEVFEKANIMFDRIKKL